MSNEPDSPRTAAYYFHVANVWQLKGNVAAAAAGYERVLQADPSFVPAHLKLGLLLMKLGRVEEARQCYERAIAVAPDSEDAKAHHRYITQLLARRGALLSGTEITRDLERLEDQTDGRIRLGNQVTFPHQRGGWASVLQSLRPLHNRKGILFDASIESNFAWKHWKDWVNPPDVLERMRREDTFDLLATSEEKGIIPYTEPWIGIVHNPPDMPRWFDYQTAPQVVFAKDVWKRSLEHCVGLIALSEHLAAWIRRATGKPVSTLLHPCDPLPLFDVDRFRANPNKKIVQIGWWLRRLSAIYELPLSRDNPLRYEKVRLLPFAKADQWHAPLLRRDREHSGGAPIDERYAANTAMLGPLPVADYDRLMSENIAFLHLYDSSANTAVVESLSRATPMLVNRLPAVVEYLGEDYPMYYDSLEEAAAKALDVSLVAATHRYMMQCDGRRKIQLDYFVSSFRASDVYRSI